MPVTILDTRNTPETKYLTAELRLMKKTNMKVNKYNT